MYELFVGLTIPKYLPKQARAKKCILKISNIERVYFYTAVWPPVRPVIKRCSNQKWWVQKLHTGPVHRRLHRGGSLYNRRLIQKEQRIKRDIPVTAMRKEENVFVSRECDWLPIRQLKETPRLKKKKRHGLSATRKKQRTGRQVNCDWRESFCIPTGNFC